MRAMLELYESAFRKLPGFFERILHLVGQRIGGDGSEFHGVLVPNDHRVIPSVPRYDDGLARDGVHEPAEVVLSLDGGDGFHEFGNGYCSYYIQNVDFTRFHARQKSSGWISEPLVRMGNVDHNEGHALVVIF